MILARNMIAKLIVYNLNHIFYFILFSFIIFCYYNLNNRDYYTEIIYKFNSNFLKKKEKKENNLI